MAENLNLKTVNTVDTRPFKRLVMTIGELPTSFIESMTYYELLAWFTNYLETVIIPTVNNNAEAVAELQALFTTLKSFVDNYFDNLDVQEEINNKLDEMVEEGTLQEIVADYLNSKAVFGFDTVADMKSATNLVNGSYAETLGYFAKNDGGSALYKIRTVTNDDVIDEQFIIEITGDATDNLVAELVHGSEINVLQLGITNTNFSSTVNSLIDDRYKVYIPKGDYVATDTINIGRAETQLVCDGNITTSATIMFYVYSYRNIIKLNGRCSGNGEVNSVLMQISGNGYTSNNNNIYVHYADEVGTGFHLNPSGGKGCAYNKINFDLLSCKKYGILIESGTGVNFVNENWFEGGRIQGYSGMLSGIKTIKGESQVDPYNGNVFNHICIDDHYDIAIDLDFATFNHFNDFRLSEGLDGSYYIKIHNGAHQNRFSSKSFINQAKVLDENTAWDKINNFDVRISDENGYTVSNRFKTNQTRKIVERSDFISAGPASYTLNFTWNGTTYTEPLYYVDGMTTVKFGHDTTTGEGETFNYVLPPVFAGQGVKTFFFCIQYISAIDSFTLKTSNDVLIADRSNTMPTGIIGNKWYKAEFVGNIQGNRWKVTPVS